MKNINKYWRILAIIAMIVVAINTFTNYDWDIPVLIISFVTLIAKFFPQKKND